MISGRQAAGQRPGMYSKGGIVIISLTKRDKKDLVKILETITFPSFKDSLISFESSIYFMSFRLKNSLNHIHFYYF